MPRASDEYRWVCAQTLPGTTRQPLQSRRSEAARTGPEAATRPASMTRSPVSTTGGRSERTTVPPVSRRVIDRLPGRPAGVAARAGQPRNRGPGRRRVAHREARTRQPVEGAQRTGHGGGGRDENRLAGPLGAVRPVGLRLLDEDALHGRHAGGRDDPERFERFGHRDAVDDLVRLAQGVAEAHVDPALHLALQRQRVDRTADVLRRDDPLEPALRVEDDDLGRPAVGEMGRGLAIGFLGRRGPVDHELAGELLPGEVLERPGAERLPQPAGGVDHGAASQDGRPRRGRLAGIELVVGVDDDTHPVGGQAQLGAHDLA